ncbi:carboxylesterase [Sulfitobacter sp. S190]|uniref:alpha/beta hydrolase n=1 Tax=Sulfitobacter sp. S190 TaxID=2867022 RepID=UPI0021A67B70|nr:lysophospholipase [Sulfitobacter sp. S190]UWR21460.1 lysophospholipase [Sulfitobacter sp. S190]
MKKLLKWTGRLMVLLVVAVLALWIFGPYEDAALTASFDDTVLEDGVDTYLAAREAAFDDITDGVQKQVIWAGAPEEKTPWSVVYLHGFSATAQEIRPVPDVVADALGANLVLTRLRGHGRSGDAMAEGSVAAWMEDTVEALAIAKRVGERVLVISTSTGGTLAAATAVDPTLSEGVAGHVLISPNFAVNNPMAPLLTFPAARYWLPIVAGERRSFEPLNDAQERYWSTEYPSVAVMPMAALVKAVNGLDLRAATAPALFIFADDDKVVSAEATQAAMAEWGGPVVAYKPALGESDDPSAHVLAGDIVSPGQTKPVTNEILRWVEGL